MARIICIANQKGGVGKTTTAINLADAVAKSGQRTLIIDLDPQCNATSGLGFAPSERHPLISKLPIHEAIVATDNPNLMMLAGSRSFQDIDELASGPQSNRYRLQNHVTQVREDFDFVFIDCPPSLGALTRSALSAADEVLMPIQCEYFAMEGLTQMIEVIRDVMQRRKGMLQFGGILLTMYDSSLELTHEVDREVREFFGEIVFDSVIPRDVSVSESASHGKTILDYAPRSRGGRAYIELTMEVLQA